jgi:hypothetical protein
MGWNVNLLQGQIKMTQKPPPGLLMSMAIRMDHALGIPGYYDQDLFGVKMYELDHGPTHSQRLRAALTTCSQLWEEASGYGFYSPEKEEDYKKFLIDNGIDPDSL